MRLMKYKILSKQNNSAMCFVCGTKNSSSAGAKFYQCENAEGEAVLVGVFQPQDIHQSYPGRMHGGIASAILDESIGRAMQITRPDIWGVTMELTTKFRAPVPLDQPLYCETKITKVQSRVFEGEGKLFCADGKTLVSAFGRFMILSVDKIAGEGMDEENWFYVQEELPPILEI